MSATRSRILEQASAPERWSAVDLRRMRRAARAAVHDLLAMRVRAWRQSEPLEIAIPGVNRLRASCQTNTDTNSPEI